MPGERSNAGKLAAAVVLVAAAGVLLWRSVRSDGGISEKAYFYDLSERQLFVADRGLIPPIRGINDATEDGVRAVVVSTNGQPDQPSTRVVAYLETCSPELKQQLSAAKAAGTAPEISRTAAQSLRLVKRPGDSVWVSLASPEGEQIVAAWLQWGTDKDPAVICTP